MAANPNQIGTQEVNFSLDREFIKKFNMEYDRLAEILGIATVERVAAGTALYQLQVTGQLNNTANAAGAYFKTADTDIVPGKTYYTVSNNVYSAVANPAKANLASYYELDILGSSSGTAYVEGDLVALSKYEVEKVPVGSIEVVPYRKQVTAQAVLKSGYVPAVLRTDDKMVKDVRAAIISKFFTFLATGTGTIDQSAATLQAALAYADAKLEDTMEDNGDSSSNIVHFVNRQDVAHYLATANITLQNVFGMNYLEDFLGVRNVFVTNKVAAHNVIATPAENIRIFGSDFGALGQMGLSYTQSANGLIGVSHEPGYDRVSAYTNVLTGAVMFAEIQNYIVKAQFTPVAGA